MDTLLLGIDAGCMPVLDPLFDDGRCPNLQSLFEGGSHAPMASQIPPWTPSAWPSMYTGVNPGKHGVYDFVHYDGYDWSLSNATHVQAPSLWEYLDFHDLTSVVVNVPVTHPASEIQGAVIPGYLAPEEPTCHPDGILDEVREEVGDYHVYPKTTDGEERVEDILELPRTRAAAFRYLCDRFDPEFGFMEFQTTDNVFHRHDGDPDAVNAVYETVDDEVGAILDAVDPRNVLVVSDHGMGRLDGYEFWLNTNLVEAGYVETTTEGQGMPSWGTIKHDALTEGEEDESTTTSPGGLERLVGIADAVGVTPRRVAGVLEALGLQGVVSSHLPDSVVGAVEEQVDFAASTAYMRSSVECGVRINLEGREPDGVVSRDQYEAVRQDVIDHLSSIETPDGRPVFEDVARREEYYHGPEVDSAVDIVTVPDGFDHSISGSIAAKQFDSPPRWHHKFEGVIAASGPDIDANADLAGATLLDVAPTVLSLLDVPPADTMDGEVLPVVEPVGSRSYPDFDERATVSTTDEDVETHLRDLGYLE